jgi:ligand-binding sensor domain-containing protein
MPNFKHYGIRDGLPSSEVYQITSDPQKNLWFVTDRGVVKYDGTIFRVYDKKDSLADNSVIKVYRDYKGRVWFIGYSGLLSYYEKGKIIPYRFNSLITQNLGTLIFVSLYVDESENVFFNDVQGDVYKIDSSGTFLKYPFNMDTALFVIHCYDSIAPSTFYHNFRKFKDVTCFKVQWPEQAFNFLVNEDIYYSHFSTTKLSNNDLIFYCGPWLIHISYNKSFTVKRFESQILNVYEDDEKKLWVGCYNNGVYVCDSSLNIISHYFTDLSVSHVFADYEGGLWFSTLENGIFYLASKNNLLFSVNENILKDKVITITNFSDSVLFFTTTNRILYKFNSYSHSLSRKDLKKEFSVLETVNFLYGAEPEKELWVGYIGRFTDTVSWVERLPWEGIKATLVNSSTKFIPQDENHLLGSGFSFVYALNKSSLVQKNINNREIHITTLFKDSKQRLFAGTLNNLSIYNDGDFIPFDSTNETLKKRITDIGEFDNHCLVIATRSDGIILYSDTVVGTITGADGLSSNNINHVAVAGNTIWAGTNSGLNKIFITSFSPLQYSIRHYNLSSGLSSEEINDFTVTKDNIYIATNEGLALIKTHEQSDASVEMPLYINSVKINDQDTAVLLSYSLNHDQNTVNITFSAVSFKHSKNVSYLYRLVGQDTVWRSTSNRDVQFTNLPPGKYKFQLLAENSEGSISKAPVEIDFDISPLFYQTIWFKLLAAFIFWVILFSAIRWRVQTVKKKTDARHALNKKFSELNLNALRSQMNPHFTFNVLNSIQYYIAKKDSESAQLYITKFSRLIRMILDQSRTQFISLAEEIKMLTLYIELEELRFENKFSYTINTNDKLNPSRIFIPGMLIQPFIENSIRHGIHFKKGAARVDVNFTTSDSILICTITDNGIGRQAAAKLKDTAEGYKSMGTAIVDERIQALSTLFDGKLKNYITDLTDENGNAAGTRVTVEIPFKILTI